jgi:hypothetical protein
LAQVRLKLNFLDGSGLDGCGLDGPGRSAFAADIVRIVAVFLSVYVFYVRRRSFSGSAW